MKNLFLLFFISATTCFAGVKESDIPNYRITGEKKDLNLPKNTARIAFHFEEHSGVCLKNRVNYKINHIMAAHPTLDTLGNYNQTIPAGTYEFEFQSPDCDTIKTTKIEIKNQTIISLFVHFHSNTVMIDADKPVIYLYPKKETNVLVSLDFKGEIDFSYPVYTNEWNVTALPDGTLKTGNNSYGYLFYEGKINAREIKTNYNEGSIVTSQKLTGFLESSLTEMGLNTKEIADFITYWAPRMMQNSENYIHFMLNEEYKQVAGIKITPQPDKMLRVYMIWSAADANTNRSLKKQLFTPLIRDGFTVIEWGGSEVKEIN